MPKIHRTHRMMFSVAEEHTEVCVLCGRIDRFPEIEKPCSASQAKREAYDTRMKTKTHTKAIFSCVGLARERTGRR